jgi:hypothetical protein
VLVSTNRRGLVLMSSDKEKYMSETKIQCNKCGLKIENRTACPVCKTDAYLLDLNNPMDAFIASGGFDKAVTQACKELPESIKQSLREVP